MLYSKPTNTVRGILLVVSIVILIGFLAYLGGFAPVAHARSPATFYIDAINGNDANDGLSEARAWKMVRKVNATQFIPGDKVLFKRGLVWRERLVVPSSGASGNPITFGAYGSGEKPILEAWVDVVRDDGHTWVLSTSVSASGKKFWYLKSGCTANNYRTKGWTIQEGSTYYRMPFLYSNGEVGQAFANYARDTLPNKAYMWVNPSMFPEYGCWTPLLRYDAGNPGALKIYAGKNTVVGTFKGSTVGNVLDTNGKDHVIVENFQLRGALTYTDGTRFMGNAVVFHGSEYVTVRNSDIGFNTHAVHFIDMGSRASRYNTLENNTIHDTGGAVVYMVEHSSYNTIKGNHIFRNYTLDGDTSVGDRLAIGITGTARQGQERTGNRIIGNVIYNNANRNSSSYFGDVLQPDGAISIYSGENTLIDGNIIFDNDQDGFYFAQGSHNSTAQRNIIIGNYVSDRHMTRHQASSNCKYLNNYVAGNDVMQTQEAPYGIKHYSIFSNDGGGGTLLQNNVFVGNTGKSTHATYDPRLIVAGASGSTINYNLYHNNVFRKANGAVAATFHRNITNTGKGVNESFGDLASWKAASGYDTNSLALDPKITQSSSGGIPSLSIGWSSPVIDAGSDLGLTTDFHGNPIYGIPDLGPIEYQPPYTMGTHAIDRAANVRVYGNGKFRNTAAPSGQTATLSIVSASNNTRQWIDVAITDWGTTKSWTETSSNVTGAVAHTVGTLTPNTNYTVAYTKGTTKTTLGSFTANSQGMIGFSYSAGYPSVTFTVASGGAGLPTIDQEVFEGR